ncbi:MAG: ribonuclease III [Gammaproteobacteria bacterium]|nr:ribonuclease III [Gammaproteobacteria bacterium]
MIDSLKNLQRRLGYQFQEPALLERALTHRSAAGQSYERLEFLGDAVLGMVIAEALFEQGPELGEGDLTRLRASLVKRETLAELARDLALDGEIRLGGGSLKAGDHRRDSILSDVMEAIIGAVCVDGGRDAAAQCIRSIYRHRLANLPDPETLKDPKTRLQQLLQARQLPLPSYEIVESSGPDHKRSFVVECKVPSLERSFRAEGSNRRAAEQAAAAQALEEIKHG